MFDRRACSKLRSRYRPCFGSRPRGRNPIYEIFENRLHHYQSCSNKRTNENSLEIPFARPLHATSKSEVFGPGNDRATETVTASTREEEKKRKEKKRERKKERKTVLALQKARPTNSRKARYSINQCKGRRKQLFCTNITETRFPRTHRYTFTHPYSTDDTMKSSEESLTQFLRNDKSQTLVSLFVSSG